jgi:hypothetical protein
MMLIYYSPLQYTLPACSPLSLYTVLYLSNRPKWSERPVGAVQVARYLKYTVKYYTITNIIACTS